MANTANLGQQIYNQGTDANPSSVGKQWNFYHFDRQVIREAAEHQYFGQLSSTRNMPKHMGKTIKKQVFFPILDDRNVNDQGIDASGASISNGNVYGSSKDTGTIVGKMPTLSEYGGRVNRVGFHRELIEGTLTLYGFFYDFTEESLDFDSDSQLLEHYRREALIAATKMNEDSIQADLLDGCGVVMYAGAATSKDTITGEGASPSEVTYGDIMRLDIILNDNRCPKTYKAIYGSTYQDTRTLPKCRVMYVGSELELQLRDMVDNFGKPAFIPFHQYGASTTQLAGEIGTIGPFKIISVDSMQHDAGAGAAATASNLGYRETNGKYNVYPMLVVGGEDSYGAPFTTIGFQRTSGGGNKYRIITKLPSADAATLAGDPYGMTGFSSISWYYGMLLERTERLAKILTVAKV